MAKAKKKTTKKTTAKKTTKAKGRTFVSFVLDETGSMGCVRDQTISGFNEYVQGLRNGGGKFSFTLTKFNEAKVEIVHHAVELKDVKNLTVETYVPANGTPLYDAIGRTIRSVEGKCGKDAVIIAIMTDGQENASKEFTRDAIFKLIDEKQKAGWVFMFLGSDKDSYIGGISLGISAKNTVVFNQANTVGVLRDVAHTHTSYANSSKCARSAMSCNMISDAHVEENKELYSRPDSKKTPTGGNA